MQNIKKKLCIRYKILNLIKLKYKNDKNDKNDGHGNLSDLDRIFNPQNSVGKIQKKNWDEKQTEKVKNNK